MGVMPDSWIIKTAKEHGLIEPFIDTQVRYVGSKRVVSYGVSSYGYDLRVADEFKVFTNTFNSIVDPKNFDSNSFVELKAKECIIPPNSFVLARSLEYFKIPRNIWVSSLISRSAFSDR